MPLLYLENYTLIKDDKGRVVGYSFVLDGIAGEDNSKEKKIPNVYIGENEIEFFTEQVKIPISSEKKSLLDFLNTKFLVPAILCRGE